MFSFLSASDRGSTKSSSTPTPLETPSSEYIIDESNLPPLEPEAPDLRELNNCLEALAAVFPDIQIDILRETLSSFDGESRLALAADALLKNSATWVKGRWRVAGSTVSDRGGARSGAQMDGSWPKLSSTEVFRSAEYMSAAESLAWHEFKGLSRSTITAVLAESNYSYLCARRSLVNLSSKSWRFAISSFFRRRPAVSLEGENHPSVIWKSLGQDTAIPCLRSTGNSELDRELYMELIAPLKARARVAQEEKDHALAITANRVEAEMLGSTYECACCFSTAAFEEFTACNAEGHMICFRCIQHSITEAVFGQGWNRSIDKESGTLRCPAIDGDGCKGCIPSDHIHRAMLEDKKGAEILAKLDQRLAEHSLLASNLPLIRCPFCSYAEVDDVHHSQREAQLSVRVDSLIFLIFFTVCLSLGLRMMPFVLRSMTVFSIIYLLLNFQVVPELRLALARFRRRRRGLKFTCQSPGCGQVSCLSCNKEWVDIHTCNESSLVALRTQVEQAMSMAVKRVCPRCNTSFVKVDGCNKLTCPCGYKMCYVCRRDICGTNGPDAGYRHFCDHFQPLGRGPCTQCNRCNLWVSENTEEVLRAAREEAERKWRETEKRELSGAEKAFLETGKLAIGKRHRVGIEEFLNGEFPSVPEICDMLVESIFV